VRQLLASLSITALLVAVAGCAAAPQPAIKNSNSSEGISRATREEMREASSRRWSIRVYEGVGPPGSPDANIVISDAPSVLQGIVDECELGETMLFHYTDGVANLEIEDPQLTPGQIDCVRRFERPGLLLEEPRIQGIEL
jgi:hypothetical protein